MLRNYLTIAVRNLRRNGGYTAINLVGLAVGLNRLWLQNLAYRIEVGAPTVVLIATVMMALVLLAMGSQTVRAAQTDSAITLRDE